MRHTYSDRSSKRRRLNSSDDSDAELISPERVSSKKRIFSLKRPARTPPATSTQNGLNRSTAPDNSKKAKKMRQTTLDLGLPATITCADCGMSYTPSQPSDAAMHAKHHAQRAATISNAPVVPLSVRRSLEVPNVVWSSREDQVVRINKRDSTAKRSFAEKILQAATNDLGAVDLSPTDLWSDYAQSPKEELESAKTERYQVFLFLRGRKCIGMALAERISSGFRVQNAGFPIVIDSSSETNISSRQQFPAVLGISRIWTHRSERRTGVAINLLDAVRTRFQLLFVINKDKVAFSQPTEQGAALARKWFGRDEGWLVYLD
jgi:N-acetyltransferase